MRPADEDARVDPRALLGAFGRQYYYPRYRPTPDGRWAMRVVAMAAARGYWGETYPISGAAILTGPAAGGRASWMAALPSEIESQEIGLLAACGHTVVCGLGMGWLACNVALRDAVTRVTIVERDAEILALASDMRILDDLPPHARDKITIVEADALAWHPDATVDSLQADIWLRFAAPEKLADVRRMQHNMQAHQVYWWGQELEIWRQACRRQQTSRPGLDWPAVRAIVAEDIRLPLVLPDWPDYPLKIAAAAAWWTPRDEAWWRDG